MADKKIMRDIGLNEPVSVTLPAHVWIGFIGAYTSTRWGSEDANAIAKEAVKQLFNPLHLKETEAAVEDELERRIFQSFITRRLRPEEPPNAEDGPI